MALDLRTKASIRRQLGLPAAGINTANTTMGLRTVTRAGQLEFYMNNLQIEEECLLLGRPYGATAIYAPVTSGNTYTVTVTVGTNSPMVATYQATLQDAAAQDPLQTVAGKLIQQMVANFVGIQFTSAIIAAQPGKPATSAAIQFSLSSLVGTFTLTMSGGLVLEQGTDFPVPSFTVDDGGGNPANAVIAYGLLPVCEALETQMLNTSQNLSFSEVGSRTTGAAIFRPDELRVRHNLLMKYRRELAVMLSYTSPGGSSGIPSFGIRM